MPVVSAMPALAAMLGQMKSREASTDAAQNRAEKSFQTLWRHRSFQERAWIAQEAKRIASKEGITREQEIRRSVEHRFWPLGLDNLGGQDITAIVFLVMMIAAKAAEEDLKSMMEEMKSKNAQKSSLRNAAHASALGAGRAVQSSMMSAKLAAQTSMINARSAAQASVSGAKSAAQSMNAQISAQASKAAAYATETARSAKSSLADKLKNDLDSMSEMGEMESLRLQNAMDRMSKMATSLSNLSKKISDASSQIVQNLK